MVAVNNSLPRIGLGMAALGRPGYINLNRSAVFDNNSNNAQERTVDLMQNQANDVMKVLFQEAKNANISPWFDCARSYGLSEKFVGEYLKSNNVKPDEVYVTSKWGYTYVADWKVKLNDGEPHEVKDHSVEVSFFFSVESHCMIFLFNSSMFVTCCNITTINRIF